jgi:hypothetical protein
LWDRKLYEHQRETMTGILFEKYPESVTELLRLQEKGFVQGVYYFIKFLNLYKKKKERV